MSFTGSGAAWRTLLPTSSETTTRASSTVSPLNPCSSSQLRSSRRTSEAEGAWNGTRRFTAFRLARLRPAVTGGLRITSSGSLLAVVPGMVPSALAIKLAANAPSTR